MHEKVCGFLGIFVMMFIAWLLSNNRKIVPVRVIAGGIFLQFSLGLVILATSWGEVLFQWLNDLVTAILATSDVGAEFLFGQNFRDHFFAFKVLSTIIFVSSLSYLLFYFGIMQRVVAGIAWVMHRTMGGSGAEGLAAAANIFCGQTEAPLFVRPYLKKMTNAEIHTMMTSGFATVAGSVLAAYVGFGISAGHLLTASLMSAPAAILISRIIYPETETPESHAGSTAVKVEIDSINAFDAACQGASDGLKLALNVGAMVVAFVSLVALINLFLKGFGGLIGTTISLEIIFGYLFRPFSLLMGVGWDDSFVVGQLLGKKLILNEFLAYMDLRDAVAAGQISDRAATIATYGLCGFANFSSVAIQIGGIGALEPSRTQDFARCGITAMIGGTLACMMTGSIAGLLL